MKTLTEQKTNILKCIAFVFVLFPFISHIYNAVFPMLYNFKILNISIIIIFFIAIINIFDRRIVLHKDIIYFVPFLLVALISSIYNHDLSVTKYCAYVVIYFYFMRRFFLHNFIFKLYVNFLVITFLVLIFIFILALNYDLYTPWKVSNLEHLSLNSPMHTVDVRAQIYYLLVFDHQDFSGLFNIPRFYGFSREGGQYVMFVIPGFLMAYFFKMKYQAFILGCAIIITSSWAGYVVVCLLLLLASLPKMQYQKIIYILFALLILIIFTRHDLAWLGIQKIDDYVKIADQTIYAYLNSVTSLSIEGILFLLSKVSYCVIVYYYYIKIKFIDIKLLLLFFISFLILINKAAELLSPLFLFYLSFIDYNYVAKKHASIVEIIENRKTR